LQRLGRVVRGEGEMDDQVVVEAAVS
jgi:hypothetical protein